MRKAFVVSCLAIAVACAPSSPSPTPPTSPQSRVVVSGTVSAAENGLPIPKVLVEVVEGVNAGRSTLADEGRYRLADLEPGTLTLRFTTSEYRDLQRTALVQANTTIDVQLERKGLTLSGRVTTQWGEPIPDAGIEARGDSGARGGGTSLQGDGVYRIPTLPVDQYTVRAIKWGYVTPERRVTMTADTTLDFVLDRVRVLLFGIVSEASPCAGVIQGAEVEVVSGPDTGVGVVTTATGYKTDRRINWGRFTLRATKAGYLPSDVSMDVVPPGSQCSIQMPNCPYSSAPSEIQQDFVLQRVGGC